MCKIISHLFECPTFQNHLFEYLRPTSHENVVIQGLTFEVDFDPKARAAKVISIDFDDFFSELLASRSIQMAFFQYLFEAVIS